MRGRGVKGRVRVPEPQEGPQLLPANLGLFLPWGCGSLGGSWHRKAPSLSPFLPASVGRAALHTLPGIPQGQDVTQLTRQTRAQSKGGARGAGAGHGVRGRGGPSLLGGARPLTCKAIVPSFWWRLLTPVPSTVLLCPVLHLTSPLTPWALRQPRGFAVQGKLLQAIILSANLQGQEGDGRTGSNGP